MRGAWCVCCAHPARLSELAKVKVSAEKVEDLRGEKIRILRYKNKTGYKKRQGHRQELTRLKITGIA